MERGIDFDFDPQEDWMVLEPVLPESAAELVLPDGFDENQTDGGSMIESYIVLKMGPWKDYPLGQEDYAGSIAVCVGDEVILEGMSTPAFPYKRKRYYCARARNIVFIVKHNKPTQEEERDAGN